MKIILDAMGGDNAPKAIVQGAVLAARETDHEIVLVGDKKQIYELLMESRAEGDRNNISVFPASENISNDESPVRAIRTRNDSSIVVGLNILKDGYGDVFISAGSTGALLVGGIFIAGRIRGIDRPAICSVYPIVGKEAALLVDAGANAECRPGNLLDFAMMGSIYMEKVLGRKNPRVGLVNIGSESKKGSTLSQKAYQLLKNSDLNFIGNVEAREIPLGCCDVIVTDGFTGNVMLKLTEGMSIVMAKQGMDMKALDYSEYGGAPILGVAKPVVKMHGSSGPKAVKSAILKGIEYAETGVVDIIRKQVER